MKCIAGIGSRKTPKVMMDLIALLGRWCLEMGIWVRSGHAPGADYAWECGAQDRTIVYLPWWSFNKDDRYHTKNIVLWDEVDLMMRQRALASISKYHPHHERLNAGGTKLMARNYFQVFGTKPEPKPVDAVVCWTPGGNGKGGTGQAIRMAKSHNIPVIDLGLNMPLFDSYQSIRDHIANVISL